MWFSIKTFGAKGAATTFMLMAIIDAGAMCYVANKRFHLNFNRLTNYITILIFGFALLVPFFVSNIIVKIVLTVIYLTFFYIVVWKLYLSKEEKNYFLLKLKYIIS